jgi:hypothetical protein
MMGTYDKIDREPYLRRAVIVIDGGEYFEWESVSVRESISNNLFRPTEPQKDFRTVLRWACATRIKRGFAYG